MPSFGPGGNIARPVSPLVEDTEGEEGEGEVTIIRKTNLTGGTTPSGPRITNHQPSKTTGNSLLRKCYPSSTTQVPFLPSGHLEDCLPPCYHGAKTMAKLIKVSKWSSVSVNNFTMW